MSLGYDFDPEWFACGQSPLCVEVDRLVRSGVVVVVAAGNSGFVFSRASTRPSLRRARASPSMPRQRRSRHHGRLDAPRDATSLRRVVFLVKGPTGDGRLKPDSLRRGEDPLLRRRKPKAQDDAAAQFQAAMTKADTKAEQIAWYAQDSGTSMAAPHVSGAIAAFLSIRREFIGRPHDVKRIFLSSATDLKRERYFQATGGSTRCAPSIN